MINFTTAHISRLSVCLLLLVFPLSQAFSQDNLLYNLTEIPNLQIYVDSFKNNLSVSDIKNKKFYSLKNIIPPNPKYSYWFKFSLINEDTQATTIKLRAYVYDSLTLISYKKEEPIIEHRGLLVKYDQKATDSFRTLSSSKYEYDISLNPDSKHDFYLRIKNKTRFESNFNSIGFYNSRNQNITATIWYLIFNAALLSILFFLSLFALMQYLQNRDLSYFFYSLFTLFYGIVMWRKFEKSNSFIHGPFLSQPEYYYHSEIPLTLITYCSQFLFVMYFVNAKKEIPFFFKILKFGIISSLIYLVFDQVIVYFLGFEMSWKAFTFFRFFLIVIASITFYYLFKLRSTLAYYLLAGTFIVFIGAILTPYLSQTLPQSFYGEWDIALLPNQISILLEALLLALGLGYKSRLTEREKANALFKLDIEKREKESQQKSRERLFNWFTNISHEIRTPLTIILGLATKIKDNPLDELNIKVTKIEQNARGLHQLTNQILDLSKLSSGIFAIKNTKIDIIKYASYLTDSFQSLAIEKNISLSYYSKSKTYEIEQDADKVKIILSNLITNAIKYTPEYGKIMIITEILSRQEMESISKDSISPNELRIGTYEPTKDYISITIKDNGPGIPPNHLRDIFDRLFRVEEIKKNSRGSGIGLSLVKELTLLLKGIVRVESLLNDGSSFSIYLPINYQEKEHVHENKSQATIYTPPIKPKKKKRKQYDKKTKKPLLLIVEDSKDVIYYLKSCLKESYEIIEGHNGQEGYELAIENIPDLIISDVMMPIKDGYQLCHDLKNNIRTSHIPFLLLTARAAQEHINKGFEVNANAYLVKPFEEKELLERLRSLLFYRNQIKNHISLYPNTINNQKVKNVKAIENEVKFINNLKEYIKKHIDDPSFKVPQLARAMTMSETQLTRKLKAITDKTPAQYIMSLRLKEAVFLIENTQMSLGAITLAVGFKQQTHFSRAFKNHYGANPSSFRK